MARVKRVCVDGVDLMIGEQPHQSAVVHGVPRMEVGQAPDSRAADQDRFENRGLGDDGADGR
jgi:hypothetical protein